MTQLALFYSLITLIISGCATIETTPKVLGSDSDFKVQVLFYKCEKNPQKTLLIMPPTGGTNYIDRSYAKKFCKNGYDVYIIESWTGMNEQISELSIHQRLYTRAQQAIAVTLEQVHTPFVGLLGTSVGAMHSAVASTQQPRINAIFSIVGGVPITDIIIHSNQQAMIQVKLVRQKKYGVKDDQDYQNKLDEVFHLEPQKSGHLYKSKSLGVVVATQDKTVPTQNQNQLVQLWKPQTIITLNNDHFWGIVKTWLFHSGELVDFFDHAHQEFVDSSKVRQ